MTNAHETAPAHHATPQLLAAIPVLTTKRLILRAPTLHDFPLMVAINDELQARSLRDGAGTREGAWDDFIQMTATWVLRGHGWWTIEFEGAAVGFIGIGFEPGDIEPELGYLLSSETRGQGFATEAALAARDWAWASAGLDSMVSYIMETNTASQNVARKLGAVRDPEAEAAIHEDKVQVWRHLRPQSGAAQ